MSQSEIMREREFSQGLALQSTDLNTKPADEDYEWEDIELSKPKPVRTSYEGDRSKQGVATTSVPLPGKTWWDYTIRGPFPGQLSGYAFASDTPVFGGILQYLAGLNGDALLDYQASNITSTDANTLSLATEQAKLGCLVAGRESSGQILGMGFAKSLGSGGPYTTQLFEDMAALTGSGVARIPTRNYYSGASDGYVPIAARIVGKADIQDYAYLGGYPQMIRIMPENDRWMIEADVRSYGGEVTDGEGGLRALTARQKLDPIVGRFGSRYTLGSQTYKTDLNDGTVDPDGVCDIRNLAISIAFDHYVTECPTGNEGVGNVHVCPYEITVEGAIPIISEFLSSNPGSGGGARNENWIVDAYNNGTAISFCAYQGRTAGKIMAIAVRQGVVQPPADPIWIDGKLYQPFTLKADYWAGDAASTDAGTASLVISVG